ncbi:hypothetical protein [Polymorphospora rubra]|uniref:hypothetical protein n=1 Tax=Polymorphospora rubra TaxID=338584 RepID=UPI0033E8053D
MSRPTPETRSAGKLVWAPNEVIARIEEQVQPQPGPAKRVALAATTAVVFTWPPAFVVFAAATIAAPSLTNGAGIGTAAFWALLFAVLTAAVAMVTALRRRADKPDVADTAPSTRATVLRIAVHALVTGGCAGLVLVWQGLSAGQIASLAGVLIVVLHLLPMIVARLLRRLRRRRQVGVSDPTP